MKAKYPNFELIEYKFLEALSQRYPEYSSVNADIALDAFPQLWPNTAGGFDQGGFSGQAFTEQYTTVISKIFETPDSEEYSYIFGVFFGNDLAYLVAQPNEVFYQDLNSRSMKSMGQAKNSYSGETKNKGDT